MKTYGIDTSVGWKIINTITNENIDTYNGSYSMLCSHSISISRKNVDDE